MSIRLPSRRRRRSASPSNVRRGRQDGGCAGLRCGWRFSQMTEPSKNPPPERPTCECCGQPKVSNGYRNGKIQWACALKNRERVNRWRKANPDKTREYDRRWKQRNPGRVRQNRQRRYEKLLEAGICTACERQPLATADGWQCNACLDKRLTPEKLLQARRRMALDRRANRHHRKEEPDG